MKKIITFALVVISLLVLSSCMVGGDDNGDGVFDVGSSDRLTVKFVIDGESKTLKVKAGERIEYPTPPEKENYVFAGWFYDEEGTEPAYLGSSLSDSVTLYACYTYDYQAAVNKISLSYIKAAVGVEVIHHKSSFGFGSSSHKISGSGVIFDEDDKYYYALTNCHVVENEAGYNTREYFVVDCFGTRYDAAVIDMDENFDLAVLAFVKGEEELVTLDFADKAGEIHDVVIAIGAPGGLDNNITFGKITRIESMEEGAVGYLGFPVVWHDAPMDHGSSGGVLLNAEFKIVGINYAVGTSPSGSEFICGLAVPLDKVVEFVNRIK